MKDSLVCADANLAIKLVLHERDSTLERLFNAVRDELDWVRWLGDYQADAPMAVPKQSPDIPSL